MNTNHVFTKSDKDIPVSVRIGTLYQLKRVTVFSQTPFSAIIHEVGSDQRLSNLTTVTIQIDDHGLMSQSATSIHYFQTVELFPDQSPLKVIYGDRTARTLSGSIEVRYNRGKILMIMKCDQQSYLAGILFHETSSFVPREPEFLKAHSIASRSYLLAMQDRHTHEGYQYCDTTHCQIFKGMDGIPEAVLNAVDASDTMALFYPIKDRGAEHPNDEGTYRPFPAFFSACCGGKITEGSHVFTNLNEADFPFHVDALENRNDWCSHSPHYRWIKTIPKSKLVPIFFETNFGSPCPTSNLAIQIKETDLSDYVTKIEVLWNGRSQTMSGETFRIKIGRNLGFSQIYSSKFTIEDHGDRIRFQGKGFGHGVGLCQHGAYEMAAQGYNFRDILKHYYPQALLVSSFGYESFYPY